MYTHIHTHTRIHTLTHTHSSIEKLIYVATRARRFFLFHTQFLALTHTHAHVVLEDVAMNLSARALSHAHLPKVPLNTHNDKHTCIQDTHLKDTQCHMHSVSMSMSASGYTCVYLCVGEREIECVHVCVYDVTCKRGSSCQIEGLSIPRSSRSFHLNPKHSNSHAFDYIGPESRVLNYW